MRSAKIQRDNADRISWLARCGCPVDISKVESSIRIEQAIGDDVTGIFDLPDGRTGCILDLRLINEGRGPRSVRGLEFTLPWSGFGFQLLHDPRETRGPYPNLYCFPGPSIEFDRDIVLNHVLFPDGILRPNFPKSGLLLGIGSPMPPEILHGIPVTGVLTLITDTGGPSTCEMEVRADRMLNPRTKAKKRSPGGLFERELETEDRTAQDDREGNVPLRAFSSARESKHGHVLAENHNRLNKEKDR